MFANLLVGIALAAGCEAFVRFPNARFLVMGYNAVKGKPDNKLHNTGFTYSVLQFTWENNVMIGREVLGTGQCPGLADTLL